MIHAIHNSIQPLALMLGEGSFSSRVLKWLVGDNPDQTGEPQLHWDNLPESWGVFVFLLVVAAIIFGVVFLYLIEQKNCPVPIKVTLAGLRLATMLLLIVLFLRPSVIYQKIDEIKPTIALLRDASLSFARGDTYRDKEVAEQLATATGLDASEIASGAVLRSELLNSAFAKDDKLIEKMREKGSIRLIDFADGVSKPILIPAITKKMREEMDKAAAENQNSAANPEGEPNGDSEGDANPDAMVQERMPDLEPNGFGSDIWQALRGALDQSERLSSILLVSDGQHNGSEDPLEVARKAAELGIPINTIGVGDPNPPTDLKVSEVYVRDKAYPNEQFEVEASIQATQRTGDTGMPSAIAVQLIQQRLDPQTNKLGPATQAKVQNVEVPMTGGRIRVDFDHTVAEPGSYVYTVKVDPLDNEKETGDNELASSVMKVVDEQVRVLLISGVPNWDYHHLRTMLQRDSTVSVSCWLQSQDKTKPQEGNVSITHLPSTREEIKEYEIIMMIDPKPDEFTAEWVDHLEWFCRNNAGGFMYMAGKQSTSDFLQLNELKGLKKILPVRFGDAEFMDTSAALAEATNQPGKMLLVNHNMDHPVMSFRSDPTETQRVWSAMPGISWSFPTLAPKPTARVLLERGDQSNVEGNQPLMVTGRLGLGRVMYIGFQGTWRWRPLGLQAQFFDMFWIQAVRFLVENRSLQGSRRGFVDTDMKQYELGSRVTLIARISDSSLMPSKEKTYPLVVTADDGREQNVTLKMLPQQPGRYEGSFVAQRTGNYTATVDLGDGDKTAIEPIKFFVVPPSAEANAFWLNEKLLREIAEQSGGKYYCLNELSELPAQLPEMTDRAIFNSPPKPIWDISWWVRLCAYLLPVLLLTVEWAMRKYFKLL